MEGATEVLAAFAGEVTSPDTAGHADEFQRALIDTLGSALAGVGAPAEQLVRRWCDQEGSVGRSTVWVTGASASAATAALCNGTAAHVLDWDDVSPGCAMHPSAVLLPALLAVAQQQDCSGPELVRAHDVGAAVFRAVTHALPRAVHYDRGWHTTATVGRLAAVAALASLLQLGEGSTRSALGLAGSLAAGSLANFGTMTKALHVGLAARDAVMATALAASAFTANDRELEADGGFFDVYGERSQARLDRLAADLRHWRSAWPTDWAQKRHPACFATHRAIDAALEIRGHLGGRPVRSVRVVVEPGGLRPLVDRLPTTGTEAKFSMAYVVAVALLRGVVRLSDFEDEALHDRAVREIMPVVSAVECDVPPMGGAPAGPGFTVVEVEAADGEVLRERVDTTLGDAARPLATDHLLAKLADGCRAAGFLPSATEELGEALRCLPSAPDMGRLNRASAHAPSRQEVGV